MMNKIIGGLLDALAHARGDENVAKTEKIRVWDLSDSMKYIYPKPVQTDQLLKLFRLAAEGDPHRGPMGKVTIVDPRDGQEISGDILDEAHVAVCEIQE